jgi:hypothetical protein
MQAIAGCLVVGQGPGPGRRPVARHFSCSSLGHRSAGRLFAAAPFSNERIAAAAANCEIPLPTQRGLQAMWQIRVSCTRVDSFGTRFGASFADDQDVDPGLLK